MMHEDESLYRIKRFNFGLAVINVCPVPLPSELLLSAHLPTSEGWTAELTVGLWFVIPTAGFEHTQGDLTRFETLRLNHSTDKWRLNMERAKASRLRIIRERERKGNHLQITQGQDAG